MATASSHLSIPAGLRLYTFTPAPDSGDQPWEKFLESDEQAAAYAQANGAVKALNEVSGIVVYQVP